MYLIKEKHIKRAFMYSSKIRTFYIFWCRARKKKERQVWMKSFMNILLCSGLFIHTIKLCFISSGNTSLFKISSSHLTFFFKLLINLRTYDVALDNLFNLLKKVMQIASFNLSLLHTKKRLLLVTLTLHNNIY